MPPRLEMRGIAKRFGATRALEHVALAAQGGRVLALIGENGAGKSTLMKILSGAVRPDAGDMRLDGRPYHPAGPQAARRAGVAMIYQELNLAPDLSVEDNIMLGAEMSRAGWLRRAPQRDRVRAALETLGHPELSPRVPAGRLSPGGRQLVEIARALVHEARVVVFDEPTSSLPQRDVEHLFRVIAKLRAAGIAVVYISHFLEEIRRVADDYLVLRDGASVAAGGLAEITDEQILTLMVGRKLDDLFPHVPHTPGEVLLEVDSLHGRPAPAGVTLQLRRGEILGLAGLVGAGRTELVRCLFGLAPVRSGAVRLAGNRLTGSPGRRIAAGVGFLSEDRKTEGLAQPLSITDNITLTRLAPYSRLGWLLQGRRRAAATEWMQRLQVKAPRCETPVASLSGGNQQKVALARVLHQEADVFLLDEPTRGIDVGTKAEIYQWMGRLAAAGKGVLFVSSYLPELLAVCDRIGVMSRGRLQAVKPATEWTKETIMAAAVGGAPRST